MAQQLHRLECLGCPRYQQDGRCCNLVTAGVAQTVWRQSGATDDEREQQRKALDRLARKFE